MDGTSAPAVRPRPEESTSLERGAGARLPIPAILLAAGTLIAGGVTVNTLTGSALALPYLQDHLTLSFFVALFLFVGLSAVLYKHRADFRAVRTLAERHARPKSALIILLSPPNQAVSFGQDGASVEGLRLPRGDADACIVALDGRKWNWQQLLRALNWHRHTLRHVVLIGSAGDRGSFGATQAAADLIEHCFGPGVRVRIREPGVSFENVQELLAALRAAISELQKHGVRRHDIAIDVTGGTKTASIAGAITTLDSNVTFQYVQTYPNYDVLEYDLEIRPPAAE